MKLVSRSWQNITNKRRNVIYYEGEPLHIFLMWIFYRRFIVIRVFMSFLNKNSVVALMFQWLWWCRVLRNMTRGVRMLVWRYPKHLIWLLQKKPAALEFSMKGDGGGKGHWFWNASGMSPAGTAATLASLLEELESIIIFFVHIRRRTNHDCFVPRWVTSQNTKRQLSHRCFRVRKCLVACIFSDQRCMCELDIKWDFISTKKIRLLQTH